MSTQSPTSNSALSESELMPDAQKTFDGSGPTPEPFVDAQKTAEFLSLRPRRVLELARRGTIPAYPLGDGRRRVWRFRLSELASALCSRALDCRRQSSAPGQETT
jgi:Helix-turn-helix domain